MLLLALLLFIHQKLPFLHIWFVCGENGCFLGVLLCCTIETMHDEWKRDVLVVSRMVQREIDINRYRIIIIIIQLSMHFILFQKCVIKDSCSTCLVFAFIPFIHPFVHLFLFLF